MDEGDWLGALKKSRASTCGCEPRSEKSSWRQGGASVQKPAVHTRVIPAGLAVRSGLRWGEAPRTQNLGGTAPQGPALHRCTREGRSSLEPLPWAPLPQALLHRRCLSTTARIPGSWEANQATPPVRLSIRALREASRGRSRPPANKVGAGGEGGVRPLPAALTLATIYLPSPRSSVCSKEGLCAEGPTPTAASRNQS